MHYNKEAKSLTFRRGSDSQGRFAAHGLGVVGEGSE